jgi:hypothetical protein
MNRFLVREIHFGGHRLSLPVRFLRRLRAGSVAVNASAKSREARLPSEPPSLSLRDFNSFKTGVVKSNVVLTMSTDIFKSIRCQN